MSTQQSSNGKVKSPSKVKKNVSLTPETIEKIKRFSEQHEVSFSAAIEGLALIGLDDDMATSVLPILTSSLFRVINRSFNRMAKLSAMSAIEAGAALEVSNAVLLQIMRSQYDRYGAEFEEKTRVPKRHPIRKVRNQVSSVARYRSVRRLKSPLAEINEIINAEEPRNE